MNNQTPDEDRLAPCSDDEIYDLVSDEPEYFDKHMALDVVEDALTSLGSSENRAFAAGLCAAFYMCGLLSNAEWRGFMAQISARGRWKAYWETRV